MRSEAALTTQVGGSCAPIEPDQVQAGKGA